MAENPIKYVADQARSVWRVSHSKGVIERFFRLIGAANSAEVIYIAEHSTGQWDTAHCTGEPVRVWEFRGEDEEGVSPGS